jgi:hypothetical protein
MKPATMIGVFFLALIAFGHLLRLLLGWGLVIGDRVIPMWPSVLVIIGDDLPGSKSTVAAP